MTSTPTASGRRDAAMALPVTTTRSNTLTFRVSAGRGEAVGASTTFRATTSASTLVPTSSAAST
jgi:hypothetical protein